MTATAGRVDVDVDLGDGRRLTGTVPGVYGNRLVSLGYSRLKPRQRLRPGSTCSRSAPRRPDEHWTGHAVGRERAGPKRALSGPLDHRAADWLRRLVELRDLGHDRAAAGADRHRRGLGRGARPRADGPGRPAGRWPRAATWETDPHNTFGIEGEDADPYHQRVFGDRRAGRGPDHRRASRPRLDDLGAAADRRRERPCERRGDRSPDSLPTDGVRRSRGRRCPIRHRPARGQRRHRQDLDHRRAGHPLRRRGPRATRADAGRHLRPRRQPGAPRARPRPAGRGRAGAQRRPRGPRAARRRAGRGVRPGPPAARLGRRPAPARPPARHRGAGRVRRRDHRDHPPVLLDGARLARRRRRHRLPSPARRGPRRPDQGDRRRPLPPRVRLRRRRPGLHPRRGDGDRAHRRQRPPGPARARRRGPHHAGRPTGQLRASRSATRSSGASAGSGSCPTTTCSASSPTPSSSPTAPPARADARPLEDRARRRVPGHRPGAVAGARPGVHRPRHDGADRRPEAGHLRLPRRRRHDVPPGRRDRGHQADAVGQLAQRRRRCSTRSSGCSTGAALGDERIVVRDVEAHHHGSRLAGAPSASPFRVRVVRRETFGKRGGGTLTVGQVRPHIARDLALDVRRLLASGATFDGEPIRAARRRGDQLPPRRPGRGPGGAAGGRSPCGDRRRRQRVRDAGRGGVAEPARGARATPPQPARPGGGAHLLLRSHRHRARRRRRGPHRSGRRHTPRVVGAVQHPRRRRRRRGRERRGAARAGAGRGRRRAPAHRPAPHRRGTPRGHPHRAARPGLPADLAARAGHRGPGRPRHRTHPPPRLRRRSRAAGDDPREQGPRVPRRLPPRRRRPLRAQADPPPVPRRRRAALRQRRWRGRRLERPLPPLAGGGGRRVAAAAVRRRHPRQVPGRLLVGADQERRRVPAPPDADARRRRGRRARHPARTDRRRGGHALRRVARPRRPDPGAGAPCRPGRRPAAARGPRPRCPALHPRGGRHRGGAPPTPR